MMNESFLVSIVIPVFNASNYLEECLNSVINQTYSNIEIIVVDDGSSDNSLEILNKYANSDKRIIVLKQNHLGVTAARMLGVKMTKGAYICSIDSDDYIDDNYVETLLKHAINKDADIVQCSFKCEGLRNDKFIFNDYELDIKDNCNKVLEDWLNGNVYFGSQIFTKIFKAQTIKNAFAKASTKINEGDDQMYFLYYLNEANKIVSIKNILYHYRYRRDSLSHKINLKWLFTELIMIDRLTKIIKEEYPKHNRPSLNSWNKRYKKMRINDYIKYKKTK